MDFNVSYTRRRKPRLKPGYSFDPVPGFQPGQSEDIGVLVARFRAGDSSGLRDLYSDDVFPIDSMMDNFDKLDLMQEFEESQASSLGDNHTDNSVSSASGLEPTPGEGSKADKPGDTEIDPVNVVDSQGS